MPNSEYCCTLYFFFLLFSILPFRSVWFLLPFAHFDDAFYFLFGARFAEHRIDRVHRYTLKQNANKKEWETVRVNHDADAWIMTATIELFFQCILYVIHTHAHIFVHRQSLTVAVAPTTRNAQIESSNRNYTYIEQKMYSPIVIVNGWIYWQRDTNAHTTIQH